MVRDALFLVVLSVQRLLDGLAFTFGLFFVQLAIHGALLGSDGALADVGSRLE